MLHANLVSEATLTHALGWPRANNRHQEQRTVWPGDRPGKPESATCICVSLAIDYFAAIRMKSEDAKEQQDYDDGDWYAE